MEDRFGKEHVAETLARYKQADREVYAQNLAEHEVPGIPARHHRAHG